MPLARLFRASQTVAERPARALGPDAQLDGDPARGRGLDDLLAAAFDACFRGELDTDWEQLSVASPSRSS